MEGQFQLHGALMLGIFMFSERIWEVYRQYPGISGVNMSQQARRQKFDGVLDSSDPDLGNGRRLQTKCCSDSMVLSAGGATKMGDGFVCRQQGWLNNQDGQAELWWIFVQCSELRGFGYFISMLSTV